jgi:two-component system chemotaxis sensor kinase CheA
MPLFDDDEIIQEFLVECNEHLDILDNGLVAIEQDPKDADTLSTIFRSIHTIKGGAGMLGYEKLEKLTHSAESLLSQLRDGKLNLNSQTITCVLKTSDAVRTMLQLISENNNDGSDDHQALIAELNMLQNASPGSDNRKKIKKPKAAAQQQESKSDIECNDILFDEEISGITLNESKKSNEDQKQNSLADASVRINVDLLDKLMNLVGELVLSRNQILQFNSTQSDSNFIAVSQRLNLITSELQEGVMKTRMQPIGNVWDKFNRVARDLATNCKKRVNLELFGSETELDKTLIEAIKDPLTHIVRNSIDHGIERPEVRRAQGKPEIGTLSLKAFHEGGHINIEIYDDGAGISVERIKAKAVEKGFISIEQALRLSERDAFNLIYIPGLSTAEQVTSISGRGVGMDVVRTNIERINGSIDIVSKPGEFTTIKIKIPLTLAIIPALIVTCNQHRYAIPQVSLLELVNLEDEDLHNNIKYIKDTPLYSLRGKLLPLIYLSKILNYPECPSVKSNHGINIVILQAGETQFGLVVDQINDTQEIVVKPLSKLLKNQQAFSGATIMGDGKISLILDVSGIAKFTGLLSNSQPDSNPNQELQDEDSAIEKQTLLLLSCNADKVMAVPLNKVDRIEEFPADSIEEAGVLEVVQYRDSIMPLLSLSKYINNYSAPAKSKDKIQVIVHSEGTKNIGLVVDYVCDIVEGSYTLHESIKRKGILGTSIIEDKVTEIIDIDSILREALPQIHY